MSNSMYLPALDGFLTAQINMTTADLRWILIDTADYAFSSSHQFLTSVPVAARVSTSATVTGVTVSNGVYDQGNFLFPIVVGDPSEAMVLYSHTGADATSRLICYVDTVPGLPVVPNSTNINVTVATFVFQLGATCP